MTKEKLFAAVKQGALARVREITESGQNVNCQDNEGRTPLIKAIEAQGLETVQYLLENGADLNISDRDGRSAFHHAVMSGVRGILQILLLKTRKVDNQDKNGQTALHYAIERKWVQIVDWLVFSGANVTLCDKVGNSASTLAEGSGAKMIEAVKQKVELERPTECRLAGHLEELKLRDVTIKFGSEKDFSATSTFLLYKSCDPSDFRDRPQVKVDEEIWGEVTECLLSQPNIQMSLTVYLQDNPGLTEIFIKYKSVGKDEKEAIATIKCLPGENWVAVAEINLATRGWFLVCNRPSNEKVPIPTDGGKITSSLVDKFVIDLPKNAFSTDGQLAIKVEDTPVVTRSMKNVISMSKFYDIEHTTGTQPTKPIQITLPLPEGYTGKGDLYVLSRSGGAVMDDLAEEEKCWSVLDTEIEIEGNCAIFTTKHFSTKTIQESKKGTSKKQVRTTTAKGSRNRKRHAVRFLVCGKPFASDTHDVVVECCNTKNLEKRLKIWMEEGYSCLRVSGRFPSKARNTFGIFIHGNIESVDNISTLNLTYLPAGKVFQHIELRVTKKSEIHSGKIAIKDLKKSPEHVKTYLPFVLDEKAYAAHSEDVQQEAVKQMKNEADAALSDDEPSAQGKYIEAELTQLLSVEDVWWKMWLYFGFPQHRVTSNPSGACEQMLPKWVRLNEKKEDLGFSKLILVLVMVDKTSDAQDVVNYLRTCSISSDCMEKYEGKPFWKWLKSRENFTIEGLCAEREKAEPMTDIFLFETINHLGTETQPLFLRLDLTSKELETIKNDAGHAGSDCVTFLTLVKLRDKNRHHPDVLESLLKVLAEMELNTGKEAIIDLIEEWIKAFPNDSKAKEYQNVIDIFK